MRGANPSIPLLTELLKESPNFIHPHYTVPSRDFLTIEMHLARQPVKPLGYLRVFHLYSGECSKMGPMPKADLGGRFI